MWRTTAIVMSACIVLQPGLAPLVSAQAGKPPFPGGRVGATAPDRDGGWPRDYSAPSGGAIRVFQPQVASWDGQSHMVAYAAVSYTAKDAAKPALGTIKLEAETSVAIPERLVDFSHIKVAEANFPGLPNDELREITATITQDVRPAALMIALDRVLARLDKSQIIPKNVAGLKADPPVIFYSTSKAILVNLDGDPIWSPIKDNDLKFAVNTNWDLFEHVPTKMFFLRSDQSWMSAADIKGPWKPAGTLPDAFAKLPADENWKDVKAALPGHAPPAAPKVYVSTTPAELILLKGAPHYSPVTGTRLLWVVNTESDVFRLGKTGPVYFLISGRWFTAAGFDGPWTFATPNLPEDFKKIPLEHARSRVLIRRSQGPIRQRKPSCWRKSRSRRGSTRNWSRRRTCNTKARRSFSRSHRRPSRGRSTRTRTSSRSAICTTCVSRASGSWDEALTARGKSPARCPGRSTKFRSARRPTPSPT